MNAEAIVLSVSSTRWARARDEENRWTQGEKASQWKDTRQWGYTCLQFGEHGQDGRVRRCTIHSVGWDDANLTSRICGETQAVNKRDTTHTHTVKTHQLRPGLRSLR